MYKLLFALILTIVLDAKDIPPQKPAGKTLNLPPIQPTQLTDYVDTCAAHYRIPRAVIVGIGTNESGWGCSPLARRSNNLFGIKKGDHWSGATSGRYRAYPSRYESVKDFCEYIKYYYPHLIGKPLSLWHIKGYAAKPYNF